MKKRIIPMLIIILSIITIVSFSIAGVLIFSSPNWFDKVSQIAGTQVTEINETKTIENTDIQSIEISGVYSDIIIKKASGSVIEASYKGNNSTFLHKGNKPEIEITNSSKSTTIDVDRISNRMNFGANWFVNTHTTLEVMIPQTFHGTLSVNSISGAVNIADLDLDNLNSKTISGAITIVNTPTKTMTLKTTSGSATLKKGSGTINFNSISGELNAQIADLTGDMTLKTISGDLNITVPKNIAFNAKLKSISGRYNPPTNYTNGGKEISANTTSGNLNIDIDENAE